MLWDNVLEDIQVDSESSKEQAKVNYWISTILYMVKPHVKGMVNTSNK